MTGRTLTVQARVIHSGRYKGREILVAGIAGSSRRNVGGNFASCIDAIVAGGAGSWLHTGMRIGGRRPGSRGVAGTTSSRCLNMRGRLGQRICTDKRAVMTSLAIGRCNSKLWIDGMP